MEFTGLDSRERDWSRNKIYVRLRDRVRIRSTVSGVDVYGRIALVDGSTMVIEAFDRSNSLIMLGRATEAEMVAFRADNIAEFLVRVIEDSGRIVRVSVTLDVDPTQRRAYQRAECWLPGELIAPTGANPRAPCRILNISVGGVLLACQCTLAVGQRLDIVIALPNTRRVLKGAIDVIREGAPRVDGDREYGCAFARLDMADALAIAELIVESLKETEGASAE